MKKIIMFFAFTLVFILSLIGCTAEGKRELTRIDVLVENQNDSHIQDKDTLVVLESIFEQIKWDDKVVQMDRKADVKAVFFYTI